MVKRVKFIKEKIDLIIKHQNISEVARRLNLNISPLKRYYDRCIREGFLQKENKVFDKGKNYSVYQYNSQTQKGQMLELHGTRLTIKIINPSKSWKENKERFFKWMPFLKSLESHKPNDKIYPKQTDYDFKDIKYFHIRTTSKSIILIQKSNQQIRIPLSKEAPKILKEMLIELTLGIIPLLEKRFLEKLSTEFETEIKLTRQHYAFIKNALANEFNKNKMALKVYGKWDNELHTIVDVSKGIIHLEEVHNKEAQPDAENQSRLIQNVNEGIFNEESVMDDIDTLKGSYNGLNEASKDNAIQLNQLIGVVRNNQDLIKGLPPVLAVLKEQITAHLKLIQEYRKENIRWRKHHKQKKSIDKDLRRWQ